MTKLFPNRKDYQLELIWNLSLQNNFQKCLPYLKTYLQKWPKDTKAKALNSIAKAVLFNEFDNEKFSKDELNEVRPMFGVLATALKRNGFKMEAEIVYQIGTQMVRNLTIRIKDISE